MAKIKYGFGNKKNPRKKLSKRREARWAKRMGIRRAKFKARV